MGTLKAVIDANGNVVKALTYDIFGNLLNDTNEGLHVNLGFAGGLYDKDTNLVRFGYRDYDSQTGKWTAKDPIGFRGGDTNLYRYVLNDPVNFVDPEGLWVPQVIGAVVSIGFEVHNNGWNWDRVAVAGITGAFGGLGKTAFQNVLAGALSNTANNAYQQYKNKCDSINYNNLAWSTVTGAIGSFTGRAFGEIGSNIRRTNVIGGLAKGNNNYSNTGGAVGAIFGSSIANQ